VICEPWSVVVVPFPFTDRATTKRRPALVLSGKGFNHHGHSVLAMITSSTHRPWPGDTAIGQLKGTGLATPSIVRLKVFTLDNRFIARRIGALDGATQSLVSSRLREALPALTD
jgi:mRNA interferase MazF